MSRYLGPGCDTSLVNAVNSLVRWARTMDTAGGVRLAKVVVDDTLLLNTDNLANPKGVKEGDVVIDSEGSLFVITGVSE